MNNESQKLTIIEQKQKAKENLIKRLEKVNIKITNLYITEHNNGKPILYPITQEIIELYKTNEKVIKKLNDELEKERQK